jgi:hypothetical protein
MELWERSLNCFFAIANVTELVGTEPGEKESNSDRCSTPFLHEAITNCDVHAVTEPVSRACPPSLTATSLASQLL